MTANPYVIKIVMLANGRPSKVDGQYIEDFKPEAHGGRGEVRITPKVKRARQFRDMGECRDFWMMQPKSAPTRPDGQPNRPMTAYTVEFIPLSEELKPTIPS